MAISDSERQYYKQGQEAKERLDNSLVPPATELFLAFEETALKGTTSDSEYSAYEKGRDGEQLDGDKGKEDEGGCYLTTACTMTLGLPDDCEELTSLRWFRDNFLLASEPGRTDVREYYAKAPGVVAAISARPDAAAIYQSIYAEVIAPCVRMIKEGRMSLAHSIYKAAVVKLFNQHGL